MYYNVITKLCAVLFAHSQLKVMITGKLFARINIALVLMIKISISFAHTGLITALLQLKRIIPVQFFADAVLPGSNTFR